MSKSLASYLINQEEFQQSFQINVSSGILFYKDKLHIKIMHISIQQQKRVHIFKKENRKYIEPNLLIRFISILDL